MKRRIAFPFLTLSESAVTAKPWSCSLNGGDWEEVTDFLPNWDAASVIRLRRTLSLKSSIAADDLGVAPSNLHLALGLRVGTGLGRLPRLILLRDLRELTGERHQEKFDFELTGDRLSGILDIQVYVVLATPSIDSGRLSPRRVAERLWSDTLRVRLEGDEPRFPIELADFRKLAGNTISAATPWYLHWSPLDWSRDFHGAARLYLNKDHTGFIERIESHDGPTLQMLLADVMGQICERLLTDPGATQIVAEAEPGTLGAQALKWLDKAWPEKDIEFIRSVLENRPGAFRAAFLDLAEPG